jgi:hypothetical protein
VLPAGWFGFAMDCKKCTGLWDQDRDEAVWSFGGNPRVYSVQRGSPAAKSGMRKGDVITHIDGTNITSEKGGELFGSVKPGQTVKWTVRRDGKSRSITVTAKDYPGGFHMIKLPAIELEMLENETARMQLLQQQLAEERVVQQLRIRERAPERVEMSAELEAKIAELKELETARVGHLTELETQLETLSARLNAIQAQSRARAPRAGYSAQTLRYSGRLAGVNVVVRSDRPVVVSEDPKTGELVITGAGLLIRMNEEDE